MSKRAHHAKRSAGEHTPPWGPGLRAAAGQGHLLARRVELVLVRDHLYTQQAGAGTQTVTLSSLHDFVEDPGTAYRLSRDLKMTQAW